MQYAIDNEGLQPDEKELKAIETQIGLTLSRFTNIVTNCSISFTNGSCAYPNNTITCHLCVSLNQIEIEITDTGDNISDVFALTLSRVKRSIERHLKRNRLNRISTSSGSRLF